MKIIETKDGCILELIVKPSSRKFQVAFDAEEVVVHSTEEPVKGKVNRQLLKELSRLFGREVELVSGFSSKEKKLFVKGGRKSEIENLLRRV